ncbi:MAG: hypothetical protein FWF91_03355 [Coriobacteriia bacterium]|nr:hypothetical protein [Coriobacteriia bacterium]
MAITFDSLVKDLLADPEAVALFEEMVPGISTNPAMKMIGGMPLSAAVKLPQSGFTPEMIEELKAKIEAMNA